MPDLSAQYERKLLARIRKTAGLIRALYEGTVEEVAIKATQLTYEGRVFSLSKYPALQKQVEALIKRMHGTIYTAVANGITESWSLSNEKNDLFVDRRVAAGRLKGKKLPDETARILYDPNRGAMEAFLKRQEAGLDLSDRIWKSLDPFRNELELGIGRGVSEGKSAQAMARDMKQYLNDPDKLFRRIRQDDGTLKLSKAAKNYKPGQGVYRSSYKNALRVARTEQNTAYRLADHNRWQGLPFVRGIRVSLSGSHPRYDICDRLAGLYPKDFVFGGWHPQCLCHATAELVSDSDYEAWEDAVLGIGDAPEPKLIEAPHAGFTDFVKENRERIAGWKNKPYWVRDNVGYYGKK